MNCKSKRIGLLAAIASILVFIAPSFAQTNFCRNAHSYRISVQDNVDSSHILFIRSRDKDIYSLKLPSQEKSYYLLRGVKKIQNGIEMDVEFGSRYYFYKKFIFVCNKGQLLLDRIKVDSFDKAYPSNWKFRTVFVRPRTLLNRFVLDKYLINP
jgi:hypothetical protein